MTDIDIAVQGEFTSNLRVNGLALACNQTGPADAFDWGYAVAGAVNVSYDPAHHQSIFVGAGTAAFTPTLLDESGNGPVYEFVFPAYVEDHDPLGYTQFVGFSATVTGLFTPAVSVGIILSIVDVPA